MRLREMMEIAGVSEEVGWRVHFERLQSGEWIPGFFPAAHERPFFSRDQADAHALVFRKRAGASFRNVRAEVDAEPWTPPAVESAPYDAKAEDKLFQRLERQMRANGHEEDVPDAIVEECVTMLRGMHRDLKEAAARGD
jgi:hypothetical protein